MAQNPGGGQLTPAQSQEITAAFMEFDANRNGFITPQEMKQCLSRSNIQYQDAEVDRVMANMDLNRDGNVSYDEYMKFMTGVYTGQYNQFQVGPNQGGPPSGPPGGNPPYNQKSTPLQSKPTSLQPKPTTPKPKPTTLQPKPTTPKPKPTTLQPKPKSTTLQPKPTTPKPKPTTLQPKPKSTTLQPKSTSIPLKLLNLA